MEFVFDRIGTHPAAPSLDREGEQCAGIRMKTFLNEAEFPFISGICLPSGGACNNGKRWARLSLEREGLSHFQNKTLLFVRYTAFTVVLLQKN